MKYPHTHHLISWPSRVEALQQRTNGQRCFLEGCSQWVTSGTCGPAVIRVEICGFITDGPQDMGRICHTCVDSFVRSLYPKRAVGINGKEICGASKVTLFLVGEAREIFGWEGVLEDVRPVAGCVYGVCKEADFEGCVAFDGKCILSRIASPWCASGECSGCVNPSRRKGYSYM